ncbi:hypothetical protein SCHPADRAFT_839051 [Schizopora paradoxa]|uniref:MATH domain-containing protein n=1 Tax=Schizopora paradoxa TaxID=27342 RepID=A0A0H2RLH7_9AGAM|nr:hypothetical protein SCHPADRAFT_839051 [Schizopora paradoxa]
MDPGGYTESTTVRLDWTVRGLKQLFDSSKGDAKSKVTKSIRFGGGKWQILFYPNSGVDGGGYISLFLSYEPTTQEKESAVNGKWVHEGKYEFSFEIRNLAKTVLFARKEAVDHDFSFKTANWGWPQFARREAVYYQPNSVRNQDAFLITCTITSLPASPPVISSTPTRTVPKELLDSVGSLLDDSRYSDVEFRLPGRRSRKLRKIYAAKSILSRADYFNSMFRSGFSESFLSGGQNKSSESLDSEIKFRGKPDSALANSYSNYTDSDEEEEDQLSDTEQAESDDGSDEMSATSNAEEKPQFDSISNTAISFSDIGDLEHEDLDKVSELNERPKLSPPPTPSQEIAEPSTEETPFPMTKDEKEEAEVADNKLKAEGPRKTIVVVSDVAYATYRAVLYYLYTDNIVFAPLSSSFNAGALRPGSPASESAPPKMQSEEQNAQGGGAIRASQSETEGSNFGLSTRRAWIKDWELNNPGRIPPCSAKAVYKIADKLDLAELKSRAFQHICKSMTVSNVPFEMFSSFSAAFEDVRKMQVSYFLDNWNAIRSAESMKNVWQQIRAGRHPGFEEVWPLIAMNLEFKPRSSDATGADTRDPNES